MSSPPNSGLPNNMFRKVLETELTKYNNENKVKEIMKKWDKFTNLLSKLDPLCLTKIGQFWYKIPTIVRDCAFLKNKVVFDVGSMCGLTSFLMLEAGSSKKVYAIDHYKHWCKCGKKAFLELGYDSSKIDFLNITINQFLASPELISQKNTVLYLSDILYHVEKRKSDLDNLEANLKNFNTVICHSRDLNTKWEEEKHLKSLGHYENIYKFLNEKNTNTFFPHSIKNHSARSSTTKDVDYPKSKNIDDYIEYSFDSFITVIRENNESSN